MAGGRALAENYSERVVFYVTPSVRKRLDISIAASGLQQPDWLRQVLEEALMRDGSEEPAAGIGYESGNPDIPVSAQLAAAQSRLEGQEEVINLLRERLQIADQQNGELNGRLQEAHLAIERMTPDIQDSGEKATVSRRPFWRFWDR